LVLWLVLLSFLLLLLLSVANSADPLL